MNLSCTIMSTSKTENNLIFCILLVCRISIRQDYKTHILNLIVLLPKLKNYMKCLCLDAHFAQDILDRHLSSRNHSTSIEPFGSFNLGWSENRYDIVFHNFIGISLSSLSLEMSKRQNVENAMRFTAFFYLCGSLLRYGDNGIYQHMYHHKLKL